MRHKRILIFDWKEHDNYRNGLVRLHLGDSKLNYIDKKMKTNEIFTSKEIVNITSHNNSQACRGPHDVACNPFYGPSP